MRAVAIIVARDRLSVDDARARPQAGEWLQLLATKRSVASPTDQVLLDQELVVL
jgi:hypothetical protein